MSANLPPLSAKGVCPRVLASWVAACWRRRIWVLAAALVVTVLALVATLTRLGVSTNTVDMLSPDLPFRQHAKALNQEFPELENRIVAVVDAPTAERGDRIANDLAHRLAHNPGIKEVYRPSGPFLRRHALYYLSPERLSALIDRLAAAQPLLATLAERPNLAGFADLVALTARNQAAAAGDSLAPLLAEMTAAARAVSAGEPRSLSWQALLPIDPLRDFKPGRRFVVITPKLDFSRLKPASEAVAAVRRAARGAMADAGAGQIRLTGEALIKQQEMQTVERSGLVTGLLSLCLVALILGAGLRSARLVAVCLLTLLVGLVWTAGVAALLVSELNIISVAFAVLFVGLGVDFAIHFVLRVRDNEHSESAVSATGAGSGCAILLSALCAAVGFLAFWPTDYRGLAELGLISAAGMAIAAGTSVTVLPALLGLVGWSTRPTRVSTVSRVLTAIAARPRGILLAAGVLGAAGLVAMPTSRFDLNPMNLRSSDTEVMRLFQQLAASSATTPYTIQLLADGPETAQASAVRFRDHSMFGQVRTLASYVPAHQDRKSELLNDAAFLLGPTLSGEITRSGLDQAARSHAIERLRDALARITNGGGALADRARALTRQLAGLDAPTQTKELERRWTVYLPDLLRLLDRALTASPFDLDDLPADLRARWVGSSGQWRVEARPAEALSNNAEIRAFAQAAREIAPSATGVPIVIDRASAVVLDAFVEASAIAAIGILVLLAATLRSIVGVVLALAPLPLAAVLTLGTAGLIGLPLNFANIIVLPLLIGLTVSSSIHLLLRWREEGEPVRALVSSTPGAVLLSVLTTLAAFGSLAISPHPGMRSMGMLLSLAIAFVVLAVLVALPALLQIVRPALGRRR